MTRGCDLCGVSYEAQRSTSRYCSSRCRSRVGNSNGMILPGPGAQVVPVTPVVAGGVRDATLEELTAAGRVDTALGRSCLALAGRLDNPGMDTGSAMAAVARQLEALLREALRGAGAATAPGQLRDELAARRAKQA